MFTTIIQPRFGDTDMLGHINNTVLAQWFEIARNPFFKIFIPGKRIDLKTFPLIMAHTEYDFLDELFFHEEVEIRTWVSRIGNKSFTIYHEAHQGNRLCVKGSAVVVHFDFKLRQTTLLPDDKKKLLEEHRIDL